MRMKKRVIVILLALCMAIGTAAAALAEETGVNWTEDRRARLRVGNTTQMRGRFFTTMWGGTTSDMDMQSLLHAYALACYDQGLTRFRFNRNAVEDAIVMDDAEGNRTYILLLDDDLYWSDGTRITTADYAFSILFSMDPAIRETGGRPTDYSWLRGADEYLNHSAEMVSGLRIISDQMMQIVVRAEALPYFYELSRFAFCPYPASVIAPGIDVKDDGNGAYLTKPLTAEMIGQTVTDPEKGYLSHPSVVSGPYILESFDGTTACLQINPYYKGNEAGMKPRIGELEYTLADNRDMISQLGDGEFGLLNKVTLAGTITEGMTGQEAMRVPFTAENYARTGLTMIWFMESSPKVQELAVRKAIADCFDRDSFVTDYVGSYGLRMDGFYGLSQWMFQLAAGLMNPPVSKELPEKEYEAAVEEYESITLDNLTLYSLDTEEAASLLETAGWKLNGEGIRSKTVDGAETELRLTMGMPESQDAEKALETHFIQYLQEIGIQVKLLLMPMDEIERAYRGERKDIDLLYLGENFHLRFNPETIRPQETAENGTDKELTAAKAELYAMAEDMVRTEPTDIAGFLRKWVALQERITETLPLLPVYSNAYFDFFTRELHNYRITQTVTWGDAIVASYMSDIEEEKEDLLYPYKVKFYTLRNTDLYQKK